MKEPTIVFYTLPFFQELARQLNADAEWSRSAKDLSLRIVCTAADRHLSFLLEINRGTVVAAEAKPDLPADFKFEARYEDWMRLCKGEAEFEKLVTTGKIRVGGSMPRLMSLMGPLNHVVVVARRFPKKFDGPRVVRHGASVVKTEAKATHDPSTRDPTLAGRRGESQEGITL